MLSSEWQKAHAMRHRLHYRLPSRERKVGRTNSAYSAQRQIVGLKQRLDRAFSCSSAETLQHSFAQAFLHRVIDNFIGLDQRARNRLDGTESVRKTKFYRAFS